MALGSLLSARSVRNPFACGSGLGLLAHQAPGSGPNRWGRRPSLSHGRGPMPFEICFQQEGGFCGNLVKLSDVRCWASAPFHLLSLVRRIYRKVTRERRDADDECKSAVGPEHCGTLLKGRLPSNSMNRRCVRYVTVLKNNSTCQRFL
jgi:hypothetical protein